MTGKEIEEARSGLAQARTLRLSSASSKRDVSLTGPVLDTLSQWYLSAVEVSHWI